MDPRCGLSTYCVLQGDSWLSFYSRPGGRNSEAHFPYKEPPAQGALDKESHGHYLTELAGPVHGREDRNSEREVTWLRSHRKSLAIRTRALSPNF